MDIHMVRRIRYPAETITDADYADNLALLVNTPAQAKSLLELAVRSIGFYVNSDKILFMGFSEDGAIFT